MHIKNGIDLLQATPGVYMMFNKANGRVYVGYSANVRARCRRHATQLRMGNHDNMKIRADCALHGPDAFCFVALKIDSEPAAIEILSGADPDRGYNLMVAGRWTKEASFLDTELKLERAGKYRRIGTHGKRGTVSRALLDTWEPNSLGT